MGNSLVDSSLKASKVADSHFRNNVFQIDIHNNPIFNEASVIEQPIVPNIITEVLYSLEMPLKTFQNGGEFRYRNAIRATVITTKDDIVTPASFNKPGSDLIKINANVEASAKYRWDLASDSSLMSKTFNGEDISTAILGNTLAIQSQQIILFLNQRFLDTIIDNALQYNQVVLIDPNDTTEQGRNDIFQKIADARADIEATFNRRIQYVDAGGIITLSSLKFYNRLIRSLNIVGSEGNFKQTTSLELGQYAGLNIKRSVLLDNFMPSTADVNMGITNIGDFDTRHIIGCMYHRFSCAQPIRYQGTVTDKNPGDYNMLVNTIFAYGVGTIYGELSRLFLDANHFPLVLLSNQIKFSDTGSNKVLVSDFEVVSLTELNSIVVDTPESWLQIEAIKVGASTIDSVLHITHDGNAPTAPATASTIANVEVSTEKTQLVQLSTLDGNNEYQIKLYLVTAATGQGGKTQQWAFNIFTPDYSTLIKQNENGKNKNKRSNLDANKDINDIIKNKDKNKGKNIK